MPNWWRAIGKDARFCARRGFDFDVQEIAVAQAEPDDVLKAGQRLTSEGAGMPAACIELREGVPRVLTTGAIAVRGAVKRRVVHQKRYAICAQLHVALEHAVAMRCA